MTERRQNIRQIEMKERMDEMFDMVCKIQERIIRLNPRLDFKTVGIPIDEFLANYRVTHGVGTYASVRYFKDFVLSKRFTKIEANKFYVTDKYYQQWIGQTPKPPRKKKTQRSNK